MSFRVDFIRDDLAADTALYTWWTTLIDIKLLQFFSLRLKESLYFLFYVVVDTLLR